MPSLTDRTVLVTGANRGMGAEYVTQLLDRGARRVWAAARDPRSVRVDDPRVTPIALDVTDPESVAPGRRRRPTTSTSSSTTPASPAGDRSSATDPTDLRAELETNLFGPLALVSAYADRLADARPASSSTSPRRCRGSPSAGRTASPRRPSPAPPTRCASSSRPAGSSSSASTSGTSTPTWSPRVEAPKVAAADVVRQVLDAVEAGASEVLADDTSRFIRSQLHEPVDVQFQRLLAAGA